MALTTEFAFTLPRGYLAPDGSIHNRGVMRLATARDEIEPLRDPRVQSVDDPYLTIIVLSRVITALGTLNAVTPREIENLFAADLAFLQDLYGVVNFGTADDVYAFLQGFFGHSAAADEAEIVESTVKSVAKSASKPKAKTASKSKTSAKTVDDDDLDDDDLDDDDLDDDEESDEDVIVVAGRRRGGAIIEEVDKD